MPKFNTVRPPSPHAFRIVSNPETESISHTLTFQNQVVLESPYTLQSVTQNQQVGPPRLFLEKASRSGLNVRVACYPRVLWSIHASRLSNTNPGSVSGLAI